MKLVEGRGHCTISFAGAEAGEAAEGRRLPIQILTTSSDPSSASGTLAAKSCRAQQLAHLAIAEAEPHMLVAGAQLFVIVTCKIDDRDAPARPENARRLRQRRRGIGSEVQHLVQQHGVEAGRSEGQIAKNPPEPVRCWRSADAAAWRAPPAAFPDSCRAPRHARHCLRTARPCVRCPYRCQSTCPSGTSASASVRQRSTSASGLWSARSSSHSLA